tara:strand:+ start:1421 stop:2536 length:1116 start_codon:yes stop_codon:yes gene_type:complete
MRIGFDAKRAFSNFTGLGNYSRDTIRVLFDYFPENEYYLFSPIITNKPRLEFINNNLNIISPKGIINKLFPSYWRSKNIIKDLKKNKIDLYHGLSHELPIGIEKTKIKTVVTIHDLIFLRFPNLFTKIDRKIYEKKFRSACENSDKIIAVSNQTKKDIINFFDIKENKIEVIYQGCNPVFKSEKKTNEILEVKKKFNLFEDYLLYVGSIEERKNLMTLLHSLNDLQNRNLIIIGDGKSYKEKCIQYIKKNNLSKKVKILTDLNLHEISCIYQNANIMIYPSIFEGFGIPILEALNSKIPVITSRGGCFLEAGGENSLYVDPMSSDEISNSIIKIDNDSKLRNKMIQLGFEHAQKFDDKIIAQNLIKAYQSL